MSEEEITALAREYAEEKTDAISFKAYADPEFKKELYTRGYTNDAKEVIDWLTRRFCLTDKAVVKEMYEKALKGMRQNTDFHTGDATAYYHTLAHYAVCCGQKATLEHIFPEIAKEVEE